MYFETITHYEEKDFELVKNMTIDEAIKILNELPMEWFSYSLPSWSLSNAVDKRDYDNYKTCCAINLAIEALEMLKEKMM